MTDTKTQLVNAGIIFGRVVQVALVLFAAVFVLGSILGGMNVIAFAAISIFALVLLAFVGVVEVGIRVGRGWVA